MTPSVSVIIPTYRGLDYIQAALESVFRQTLLPGEIIVVDDASPDGTVEVVSRCLSASSVTSRVIRMPQNSGGPAAPINIGIAAASGEFIAVLDQDDVLAPDKLREQVMALAERPECSFVFGQCCLLSQPEIVLDGPVLAELIGKIGQLDQGVHRLTGQGLLRRFLLDGHCVIGYPGFLFRRADWLRKGGINERLRIAGDYDFLCWLCNQGDALYVPRVHYYRREHGLNLTTNREAIRVEMAQVRALYARVNNDLARDRVFQRTLQGRFVANAYILRNHGYYREAWKVLSIAAGVWGWQPTFISSVAKMGVHWLGRSLGKR